MFQDITVLSLTLKAFTCFGDDANGIQCASFFPLCFSVLHILCAPEIAPVQPVQLQPLQPCHTGLVLEISSLTEETQQPLSAAPPT